MSADEEDEDEVNVPSKRLKSVSNPSPAAGALPDVTLDEDGNAYWEVRSITGHKKAPVTMIS